MTNTDDLIDLTDCRFRITDFKKIREDDISISYNAKEIEYCFVVKEDNKNNSVLFINPDPEEILKNLNKGDLIKIKGEFKDLKFGYPYSEDTIKFILEDIVYVDYVKRCTYVDLHWLLEGYTIGLNFNFKVNKEISYATRLRRWFYNRKQQTSRN